MKPVIREAIVSALKQDRPYYARQGKSKLYPSGAGKCHTGRKEILRVENAKSTAFPFRAIEAMNDGNVYEASTLALLEAHFGKENVLAQLPLKDEHWSGKTDMIIYHKTPKVIIVEHKATGDKWFDYKQSLPHEDHVFQLAKYKSMYSEQFGFVPKLILYYRSWGQWAEFEIDVQTEQIVCTGQVFANNKLTEREVIVPMNLKAYVKKLEWYYDRNKLPHRVAQEDQEKSGCTFKGEPSCGFFSHCWPREKDFTEIETEEKK